MRKPYYNVTARCRNDRCETEEFTEERKHIVKKGTDGREYEISVLACPQCRCWGPVMKIKEVA